MLSALDPIERSALFQSHGTLSRNQSKLAPNALIRPIIESWHREKAGRVQRSLLAGRGL
jgi:hypothetical protein